MAWKMSSGAAVKRRHAAGREEGGRREWRRHCLPGEAPAAGACAGQAVLRHARGALPADCSFSLSFHYDFVACFCHSSILFFFSHACFSMPPLPCLRHIFLPIIFSSTCRPLSDISIFMTCHLFHAAVVQTTLSPVTRYKEYEMKRNACSEGSVASAKMMVAFLASPLYCFHYCFSLFRRHAFVRNASTCPFIIRFFFLLHYCRRLLHLIR